MSRSNYVDDPENLAMWRGAVRSAIFGKRGQKLLRDLAAALDAMPQKRLIADDLVDAEGEVCAFGCLGKARGIDMSGIDPECPEQVAKAFGIAYAMAAEIEYLNDEVCVVATPEQRWTRMRAWVAEHIKENPDHG